MDESTHQNVSAPFYSTEKKEKSVVGMLLVRHRKGLKKEPSEIADMYHISINTYMEMENGNFPILDFSYLNFLVQFIPSYEWNNINAENDDVVIEVRKFMSLGINLPDKKKNPVGYAIAKHRFEQNLTVNALAKKLNLDSSLLQRLEDTAGIDFIQPRTYRALVPIVPNDILLRQYGYNGQSTSFSTISKQETKTMASPPPKRQTAAGGVSLDSQKTPMSKPNNADTGKPKGISQSGNTVDSAASVGELLNKYRTADNLTAEFLCSSYGITPQDYALLEQGRIQNLTPNMCRLIIALVPFPDLAMFPISNPEVNTIAHYLAEGIMLDIGSRYTPSFRETIGSFLKEYRDEKNYSISALAARLGVSKELLTQCEQFPHRSVPSSITKGVRSLVQSELEYKVLLDHTERYAHFHAIKELEAKCPPENRGVGYYLDVNRIRHSFTQDRLISSLGIAKDSVRKILENTHKELTALEVKALAKFIPLWDILAMPDTPDSRALLREAVGLNETDTERKNAIYAENLSGYLQAYRAIKQYSVRSMASMLCFSPAAYQQMENGTIDYLPLSEQLHLEAIMTPSTAEKYAIRLNAKFNATGHDVAPEDGKTNPISNTENPVTDDNLPEYSSEAGPAENENRVSVKTDGAVTEKESGLHESKPQPVDSRSRSCYHLAAIPGKTLLDIAQSAKAPAATKPAEKNNSGKEDASPTTTGDAHPEPVKVPDTMPKIAVRPSPSFAPIPVPAIPAIPEKQTGSNLPVEPSKTAVPVDQQAKGIFAFHLQIAIAEAVSTYRAAKNMTIDEMAADFDVSPDVLRGLENGTGRISMDILNKISSILPEKLLQSGKTPEGKGKSLTDTTPEPHPDSVRTNKAGSGPSQKSVNTKGSAMTKKNSGEPELPRITEIPAGPMPDVSNRIAYMLQNYRERTSISRAALAKKLGISPNTLRSLENPNICSGFSPGTRHALETIIDGKILEELLPPMVVPEKQTEKQEHLLGKATEKETGPAEEKLAPKSSTNIVGSYLKHFRAENGFSPEEMAELVGLPSRVALYLLEGGRFNSFTDPILQNLSEIILPQDLAVMSDKDPVVQLIRNHVSSKNDNGPAIFPYQEEVPPLFAELPKMPPVITEPTPGIHSKVKTSDKPAQSEPNPPADIPVRITEQEAPIIPCPEELVSDEDRTEPESAPLGVSDTSDIQRVVTGLKEILAAVGFTEDGSIVDNDDDFAYGMTVRSTNDDALWGLDFALEDSQPIKRLLRDTIGKTMMYPEFRKVSLVYLRPLTNIEKEQILSLRSIGYERDVSVLHYDPEQKRVFNEFEISFNNNEHGIYNLASPDPSIRAKSAIAYAKWKMAITP